MTPLELRKRFFHHLLSRPLPPHLYYGGELLGQPPLGADAAQYVSFRWLGAAGFEITHGDHQILIDPYFTRAGLLSTAFAPLRPDVEAIERGMQAPDGIITGHSHHDHAMDVGELARLSGAPVFGSKSTMRICEGLVSDDKLHQVAAGDRFDVGPFACKVIRSRHSKLFLNRVPLPGEIAKSMAGGGHLINYRDGGTTGIYGEIGGLRFLHLGSADFFDEELEGVEVDILMVCIIGRQKTKDFTRRLLSFTRPRIIIPCHWDNFFLPLSDPPRAFPGVHCERFEQEVSEIRPETTVVWLNFLSQISMRAPQSSIGARPWTRKDALDSLKPLDALPPNLKAPKKARKKKKRS